MKCFSELLSRNTRFSILMGLALLSLAVLLAAERKAGAQVPAAPATQKIDRNRLEIVEDLSESLANDLLALSIATRDRDTQTTAQFFPDQLVATPVWSQPSPLKVEVKWLGTRTWSPEAAPFNATTTTAPPLMNSSRERTGAAAAAHGAGSTISTGASPARKMTREEFLSGWNKVLEHFAEIEDSRFKVKQSEFEATANASNDGTTVTVTKGSAGHARVAFYIIGRNRDEQREWVRGVADVVARYGTNNRWQFDNFTLISFDSMVATTDLFSEVSQPAGIAASLPAYGAPGSGGFIWHGAAAADFNRDGFIDLFVTAPDRNYLYLNDGQGHFRDASEETGVKFLPAGVAPLVLDYDNDGDADIFLSAVGTQMLLQNRLQDDGKLEFRDVSLESSVGNSQAIGFSAVAGDVNGDGLPDIYVASYNRYGQVTPNSWFRATNGTPNLLFINQGDGTFKEEAAKWGVDDHRWSYAAAFADINGDGKLDLYVANDFGEKALFINKGGHFVDEAKERGVLDPGNGMGVSFGDYNNDGLLDLHTTNMSSTAGNRILARLFPNQSPQDNVLKKLAAGNNLYQNSGGGHYRDVTAEAGNFSGGWAWGGGFIDFDNDGWEDIYTPNGFISGKSMKDT